MIGLATVGTWLRSLAPKFLGWFIPRIPALISSLITRLGLGAPRWVYRIWLLSRYRGMPFIYRDLKLEVLNDFVELKLSSLDSSTLMSQQQGVYDARSAIDKMRDYRRGLFFGEGGIGKTTFFRFATLNIIGSGAGDRVVNKSESIIPFFVPLKALDNSSDHPVIDALIDNNPYLGRNKKHAISKLKKLARSRRAAFFLDGYDEIPYAGGNQSIIEEISALFSPFDEKPRLVGGRSEYSEFYRMARHCRVYLSSRREFFISHPINAPRDVPRWEVVGLTDKRSVLVGNIFRNYKKERPDIFSDTLNVEEFMRQLALSRDQGFEEISENPLFLTAICFVYVNEIRGGFPAGSMFNRDSSTLVERCIHLLLSGIDEAKTEGLSAIDASALIHRRSAWPEQKFAALQYVAGCMYLENHWVLSLEVLTELLKRHFLSNLHVTEADAIVVGLSKPNPLANMAIQLTRSGVLVVVERRRTGELYDFPHRRFKETLAIAHFVKGAGIQRLIERISDPSFYDLILLVADTQDGWAPIMDALKKVLGNGDGGSVAKLILQVMPKAKSSIEAANAAKGLLELVIQRSEMAISLPSKLKEYLPRDSSYARTLCTLLGQVVRSDDLWSFALIAEALLATSTGLSQTIEDVQGLLLNSSSFDWQLLYIVNKFRGQANLRQCIDWLLSRRSMTSVNDTITGIVFVVLVGRTANRDVVQDCLLRWMQKLGDYRFKFFESREKFDEVIEVFVATGSLSDDETKLHFSRGGVPKIVDPWS